MEYEVTKELNKLPTDRGAIVGRECKFVSYVPEDDRIDRKDMHYVKEVVTFEDGSSVRNLRPMPNYKRSFWVTKEFNKNHKQKKETEDISKLNRYTCTQSELPRVAASKLGSKYVGCKAMRDIANDPYLYGTDIRAADEIMYKYTKKYPNYSSPNIVCALDIETNTLTDEIILISVCMEDRIFTTILESFLPHQVDVTKILEDMARKNFPDREVAKTIKLEYKICKTELDVIRDAINKVHEWQPDFLAIWNISFDIPYIVDRLKQYDVDPAEVFSDPRLPDNYKYFKWKSGTTQKVTASGKVKPMAPQEQWHTVEVPATFFLIDAMSAYNFVRSGQALNPGGYSLNAIIETNLGSKFKKLHFDDPNTKNLTNLEWHQYMVANKPFEYVIYNQWDTLAMITLDNEIQDLKIKIRALSGIADYSIFNSGPKKIITNMFFFNLEHGQVMSCRPSITKDDDEDDESSVQALSNWIVMLDIDQIYPSKVNHIGDFYENDHDQMIKEYVFDAD